MTTIVLEMKSLEDLEERTARVLAREEGDEEAMLDELIRAMVRVEPPEAEEVPGEEGSDEFTCRLCHLILCRSRLADENEILCVDCHPGQRSHPR
jgi:hypothetical protein